MKEVTSFCLCESNAVFLCPSCLSKHKGHEVIPMAQYELFQALGRDEAELRHRILRSRRCQSFLDKVKERETSVQLEARTLLSSVQKIYEMWLEGNHRCFESLITMLRAETAFLLARPKYKLSPITKKLIDRLDSLNSEDEKRFSCIPEINTWMHLNQKCLEACSRGPMTWQVEYGDEVLRAFTELQAFQEKESSASDDAAALLLLTRKLEDTTRQLQVTSEHCGSLEKEIETLRNLGQSSITQLQEPVPDYSTPQSRAALVKFGPYSGQDDEHWLVKRGPVMDESGVYIGQWNANNEKHGYGKYLWKNGDSYEGQWRNGQSTGRGRFIWAGGSVYVGDFVQGRKEGFGTFYYANGDEYSGTLVDDKWEGVGLYKYREPSQGAGDRYIGEHRDGLRSGVGAYFWASGSTYVGSWKSNSKHGKGLMSWPDWTIYFGDYADDLVAGTGNCAYLTGEVYRGKLELSKEYEQDGLAHPGKIE